MSNAARIWNKARERLTARRGFTLAELLIAVLILLLATTVIASMMTLAARHYRNEMQQTKAELLCSTLSSSVQNELTYAGHVRAENGVILFDSHARSGTGCRFMIYDNGTYSDVSDAPTAAGRVDLRQTEGNPDFPAYNDRYDLPLVDDAFYRSGGDGVKAGLGLSWDESAERFHVAVTVWDAQGEELASDVFDVKPISPGV